MTVIMNCEMHHTIIPQVLGVFCSDICPPRIVRAGHSCCIRVIKYLQEEKFAVPLMLEIAKIISS